MPTERLFTNARLVTLAANSDGLGVIEDGALLVRGARIAAVGPRSSVEAGVTASVGVGAGEGGVEAGEDGAESGAGPATGVERIDLGGRWVTPAPIDAHTHLVFAGNRSDEWARRLAGESYAAIARSGGGILSTVRATRAADLETLTEGAARRLARLAEDGVGTVEIKSGYGLDHDTELRMLRAARAAGDRVGVRVRTTLLAAHAVPPEYAGRADDYLAEVCLPLVREVAAEGLADAVDAFCESIAFSPAQLRPMFAAARDAGLAVRLHADQLEDGGGAALAAEFGARSADHLEYTSAAGVRAMAEAGTVAVLLPGAFLHLGETQPPPVAALRRHGVPIAVATDANPGSSPLLSLTTAAHLACSLFGTTVEEGWAGITRNAARALGLGDDLGTLEVGRLADFAVWEAAPAEVLRWIGDRPLHSRWREGVRA